MREKLLATLLLFALAEIAFDWVKYHSHTAHAASGRAVRVQPSLLKYPYPSKFVVGSEVLGFSCIESITPGQSNRGPGPATPECFVLTSDD